ncbi:MAG: TlpA family protein disulfide reductase [Candidatus Krumholzibacteriia bacterium]
MNRSCRLALFLGIVLLSAGCGGKPASHSDPAAEVAASTLTAVGDEAPDFTAELLDGGSFQLAGQRGKVVLVNWWATWCPPCVEEMPHLQEKVWERFRGEDFAMVAVSRAETPEVVAPWIAARGFTFPVALDRERTAYALFASAYIPRSYVIGRDGRILFQSQGYEEAEFGRMVATIESALAAAP